MFVKFVGIALSYLFFVMIENLDYNAQIHNGNQIIIAICAYPYFFLTYSG